MYEIPDDYSYLNLENLEFINIGKEFNNYIRTKYSFNNDVSLIEYGKKNNDVKKEFKNNLPKNKLSCFIYNRIYENTFISNQCITWIETIANNIQIITINKNIKLYIINTEPVKITIINHLVRIIKWIITISKNNNKLDIILCLTPYKKYIDSKNTELSIANVNSGATYIHHNWIIIFRFEEIFKVLIHELIHFTELDVNNTNWIDELNLITVPKCIPVYFNEAVTETMAIILHSAYYAKYTDNDFKFILENEKKYSMMMYHLILYHLNIKKKEDIFDICMTTNVLSYYIFKYLLLINEDFQINMFNKNKIEKILIKTIDKLNINDLSHVLDDFFSKRNYLYSTKMSYYNLIDRL